MLRGDCWVLVLPGRPKLEQFTAASLHSEHQRFYQFFRSCMVLKALTGPSGVAPFQIPVLERRSSQPRSGSSTPLPMSPVSLNPLLSPPDKSPSSSNLERLPLLSEASSSNTKGVLVSLHRRVRQ